jgi:deoxyxylulose-5-phosphate synthase
VPEREAIVTAEIAVMNQEAVALAADSAVSGPKIFTSANKIFALSKYQPIAVMVNDSAQFLGVPWETIIKTYRALLGKRSFSTLKQQAAHFLGFFDQANTLFSRRAQEEANELLFWNGFTEILSYIDRQLEERTAQGEELSEEQIEDEAAKIVRALHKAWMSADNAPSLPKGV